MNQLTTLKRVREWLRYGLPSRRSMTLILGTSIVYRLLIEAWRFVQPEVFALFVSPDFHFEVNGRRQQNVMMGIPIFAGFSYGTVRAFSRNPLVNLTYRHWLLNTPWAWPQPLPWGGLLPCWQDVVGLFLVALVFLGLPGFVAWALLLTAVGAYAFWTSVIVFGTQPCRELYLVPWFTAAAIHFQLEAAVCIAAITLAVSSAAWALSRTLYRLDSLDEPFMGRPLFRPIPDRRQGKLSWPWEVLTPNRRGPLVSVANAVLFGLTAAAAIWAFEPFADPSWRWDLSAEDYRESLHEQRKSALLLTAFAALASCVRLLIYKRGTKAPLTLYGRIKTGRIILAKHDRVFLAPMVLLATAYPLPFFLARTDLSLANQMAIGFGLLTTLVFALPPSQEAFQLTGNLTLTDSWIKANEGSRERSYRRRAKQ